MLARIAFRNILRNARRSFMTMSAIAVGAIALILFGEFMAFVITGLQTSTVQKVGHLSVFRTGYFDFGAGNPGAYGIADYRGVIRMIREDPVLAPLVEVATPTVTLYGIAGNFDIDASRTFIGTGFVPSDRQKMLGWNDYGLPPRPPEDVGLRDDDPSRGVLGIGLARILGLCERLKLSNCPPRRPAPPAATATAAAPDAALPPGIAGLAEAERPAAAPGPSAPRIDLLAATAGGAPNVVTLRVAGAEQQGAKELDDAYVAMHLSLAQQLLYGRGEHKAVAIVLQLHHTRDMGVARARLNALFKEHGLDLEVRDFTELQPFYKQVMGMFGAIFLFIAIIMGVIVLFAVVNTMGMSVMERTTEIGTARAMGVRRRGIRRQFLLEGWMLGAIGACAGVVLAMVLAAIVNGAGLTWMPPGQSAPVPLRLLTAGVLPLQAGVWIGLVLMATIAAFLPANRAARLPVVDALRHV